MDFILKKIALTRPDKDFNEKLLEEAKKLKAEAYAKLDQALEEVAQIEIKAHCEHEWEDGWYEEPKQKERPLMFKFGKTITTKQYWKCAKCDYFHCPEE